MYARMQTIPPEFQNAWMKNYVWWRNEKKKKKRNNSMPLRKGLIVRSQQIWNNGPLTQLFLNAMRWRGHEFRPIICENNGWWWNNKANKKSVLHQGIPIILSGKTYNATRTAPWGWTRSCSRSFPRWFNNNLASTLIYNIIIIIRAIRYKSFEMKAYRF